MIRHKTLRGAYQDGVQYLAACGIEDATVDAWLLLAHVTGITRTYFLAEGGTALTPEQHACYQEFIFSRGSHIPLQHLTGQQEFMGLSFRVNEHVLIPRQDTEILVEEALRRLRPGMRVLDLCTGSGCIAISLAKLARAQFSSMASKQKMAEMDTEKKWERGTKSETETEAAGGSEWMGNWKLETEAADISEQALAVAAENAEHLGADVRLIQSDLFERISGQYDMIVSNPPYIRSDVIDTLSEEVRLHEPHQALDGREDGLYFYRSIIRDSREHLSAGGWLLFEIGYDQGLQVKTLMSEGGFSEIEVKQDLAGLDRVVLGRCTV